MTYALALQLKNAGFPQEVIFGSLIYNHKYKDKPEIEVLNDGCWSCECECPHVSFPPEEYVKIPTLSELIEACEGKITLLEFKVNGVVAKGVIFHGLKYADELYTNENMQPNEYFLTTGSTPEEAVANLWLAINK